jgi:hypothetical protein
MMLITGKVVNATTNEPVKGARVVIRVGGREVSTHARADAAFEWRDDQSHAGEVVEVTVREEGFVPWQVTQEVQANEAVFEIRLQPVGERTVTGTFLVKDSAGEPVSGAEIGLQGAAGPIASAVSDAQGEASITVSAEVAGRPVGYTVRKDGFVEASGRADLSGTQPVEIVMERAEPATNLLPWLIGGGVGLLAAVLVIAVVVDRADTDGTGGRVEVQPAESVDVVEAEPVDDLEAEPVDDQPSSELVSVPDLDGLPVEAATNRLAEAGLRAGRSTLYTLGRYPPGTVYGQETAPGTRVRPGTAIGLYVERAPRRGIASSGRMFLSSTEVWDLDGEDEGREDVDIRFESTDQRFLQALNGAAIGPVGRSPLDRNGCASASLSASPVQLDVGAYFCVRTTRGRLSLLRVEDLGADLELSFDTWQADDASTPAASVRQIRLSAGDSYHFSSGIRGQFQGGDLYLTIAENGAAQFFANNRDQRGLVDLGDLGSPSLSDVRVPERGYYQFGVPVVSGHTYVSLARAGEEGHFIVFKVDQVTNEFVALSYVYR